MNINRNNYEEFFILYWDNELTADEKQAVENFIKANTDLEEEFKSFGDTRFFADKNILLEEKEFLNSDSFINITSFEDQLLDYIDNELKPAEKESVEKFANKFPAIQKELTLLQKTKIQPEAETVFPDRSLLYRHEEKVRVISIQWRRYAVAAAILLIGGFATIRLLNTSNGNIDKPTTAKVEEIINPVITKDPAQSIESNSLANNATTNESEVSKKKTKPSSEKSEKPEEHRVNSTASEALADNKPENKNNLPKEGGKTDLLNNSSLSDQTIASVTIPQLDEKYNNAVQKNNNAINTSLDNSDVTLKPGYALNIETPPIEVQEKDGGGLKELLRKTTRVFERRTKIQTTTDDNKLLVGAFAVSLK